MSGREPVLKLIIAYKLVRASLALLLGVVLLVLIPARLDVSLRELAGRLSVADLGLSTLLLWAAEPGHLLTMGALLTLDGVITFVEGWALLRGWRWGPWLVVFASSLLLPFELAAIAAHVTVWRVGALTLNLAIVGWLLRARLLRAPDLKVERALKTGSGSSEVPASLP